jgi:di/tricarboxylate transporter
LGWEAWFTLAVIGVVFVLMLKDVGSPDVLLLGGTLILCVAGIISASEAFAGFSNEAMLTVAGLFVVVAGLRETGALDAIGHRMLGGAKTQTQAMGRMSLWINTVLIFLTNTSIVAMLMPIVMDWCRKNRISPSRLLMPLSYVTVLRGCTTLIGTSTNLVVSGLMVAAVATQQDPVVKHALRPVSLFEITPVGAPIAILGVLYLMLVAPKLLPDRKDLLDQVGDSSREYLVEMTVQPECRLAGQTVEEAGLRHLPGLFLIEIRRKDGRTLSPVGPEMVIQADDMLTFTGAVSGIVDLERIPGLVPAADDGYRAGARSRRLCEAVISPTSPLIGQTIREADFRAIYNAAVVAVHRGGRRLTGRVGDIVLREGDTLLLQTGAHFARAHHNNPEFILVSNLEEARPIRHDKARVALVILFFTILLIAVANKEFKFWGTTLHTPDIHIGAFVGALLMVLTRCISIPEARSSPNWQTLLSIAAAFGIGKALQNSGAAKAIADMVVGNTSWGGPVLVLGACYLVTMVLTELLSNAAAAALMFPFALEMADTMGVSPRPFAISIMFAASLAFATPVGYQTNLMVYAPGGYKFSDFTKVGLPLNIMVWLVCWALIPVFWPFALR